MKALRAQELPALPAEIKALVREGVYSLYELRDVAARFLLLTKSNEYYFLSAAGDVVGHPAVRDVNDANIGDAVTFADANSGAGVSINFC